MVWRTLAVGTGLAASWLPGADTPEAMRLILVTQFPSYCVQFAAGMTAAWIFVKLRSAHVNRLAWITVPVQVAAVVAIVAGMRNAGARDVTATAGLYDHFTGTTFVALSFAVLILATVLAPAWAQLPMTNPVARRFGDISYGVYLWHLLLIGFALHTLHFQPTGTLWAFVRMLGFVLAGSIVAGWLSLRFVEKPAIQWARRRSKAMEGRNVRPRPRTRTGSCHPRRPDPGPTGIRHSGAVPLSAGSRLGRAAREAAPSSMVGAGRAAERVCRDSTAGRRPGRLPSVRSVALLHLRRHRD